MNLHDGDLLFFSSQKNGGIDHVGMALSDGRMIDSSGVKTYGLGVGLSSRLGSPRAKTYVKAMRLRPEARRGFKCL